MNKPTPFFVATIVALVFVIGAIFIFTAVMDYERNRQAEQLLKSQRQLWAPPTFSCDGSVDLYRCITTGENHETENR